MTITLPKVTISDSITYTVPSMFGPLPDKRTDSEKLADVLRDLGESLRRVSELLGSPNGRDANRRERESLGRVLDLLKSELARMASPPGDQP